MPLDSCKPERLPFISKYADGTFERSAMAVSDSISTRACGGGSSAGRNIATARRASRAENEPDAAAHRSVDTLDRMDGPASMLSSRASGSHSSRSVPSSARSAASRFVVESCNSALTAASASPCRPSGARRATRSSTHSAASLATTIGADVRPPLVPPDAAVVPEAAPRGALAPCPAARAMLKSPAPMSSQASASKPRSNVLVGRPP
mmetsp:Transcript_10985/g.45545  ORF Transcript_10985/g.45545 Transcript_10985/m.45545 type:complete len:207 (-) Transcript_10985:2135-2755(-)